MIRLRTVALTCRQLSWKPKRPGKSGRRIPVSRNALNRVVPCQAPVDGPETIHSLHLVVQYRPERTSGLLRLLLWLLRCFGTYRTQCRRRDQGSKNDGASTPGSCPVTSEQISSTLFHRVLPQLTPDAKRQDAVRCSAGEEHSDLGCSCQAAGLQHDGTQLFGLGKLPVQACALSRVRVREGGGFFGL